MSSLAFDVCIHFILCNCVEFWSLIAHTDVSHGGRVGFHQCLSVCLFSTLYLKINVARITKRDVQMFHNESWKPVYLGSKGHELRKQC